MNDYDYIIDAFTRDGNNTNLEVNNLNVGCITSTNNNFELDSSGNLTVNSITTNNIVGQAVANAVYPIGSIYMSVNNTNPSTLFGGQWEQLKDKFFFFFCDIYANGQTGGEASHTLTVNEIPAHNHTGTTNTTGAHRHGYNGWWTFAAGNTQGAVAHTRLSDGERWDPFNSAGDHSHTLNINNTGGSQAHNNMPPYLAVYMWKRIS